MGKRAHDILALIAGLLILGGAAMAIGAADSTCLDAVCANDRDSQRNLAWVLIALGLVASAVAVFLIKRRKSDD